MHLHFSRGTKHFLYGAITMLALISTGKLGYQAYQNHQANNVMEQGSSSGISVSASSSLYQSVRRNDLDILHKVGNKEAKTADAQYIRYVSNADATGGYPVYKPDKHGNYWSWFENHQAVMNDNFDIGNENSVSNMVGSGLHGLVPDVSRTASGMIANEKVLENHGVSSGVNFPYFAKHGGSYDNPN